MLKIFNSFNNDFQKFEQNFNIKPLSDKQEDKKYVEFNKLITKLEKVREKDLEQIDARPGAKKTKKNVTVLTAFGMINKLEGQINKVKNELVKVNKQIDARAAAKRQIAAYERSNGQFHQNLNGLLAQGPGRQAPAKPKSSKSKPVESRDDQLTAKQLKLTTQLEKFKKYQGRIDMIRDKWSRHLPVQNQARAQQNWKRLHDRAWVIIEGNSADKPTTKNLWAEATVFKLNKPNGKRTPSTKFKLSHLQPYITEWKAARTGTPFRKYVQDKLDAWMQQEKTTGATPAELTEFRTHVIKSKKDLTLPDLQGPTDRKMLAELYWREPIEFQLNSNAHEGTVPCRLYINQVKAHFEAWEKSNYTGSFQQYLQDKLNNWMQEENNTGITPPELATFRNNRVQMFRPEERHQFEVEFQNGIIMQNGVQLKDSSDQVQYIFVLAKHPEKDRQSEPPMFLVTEKKTGQVQHSSFFNGKGVISAGMLEIKNGKIVEINNHSGHYQPTREMTLKAVKYLASPDRLGPREIKKVKINAMREWQWYIFNKLIMPIHIWRSNRKK